MFPEVKEEYFDEDIERQVKRMQTVIELTRTIRERHNLSLKVGLSRHLQARRSSILMHYFPPQTPLKELLVFHADGKYLADIQPLQRYIQSELNVRDIVLTADEAETGIQYRAVADWAVLGRKLRKDLGKVKAALPALASDDVRRYAETGAVRVAGIELVAGDLAVQRYIALADAATHATHTDNDVVVRLDVQSHPELKGEWLAREVVNRVQKLRKKAGLQATDDVDVFYAFEERAGEGEGDGAGAEELLAAMGEHAELIRRTVRNAPVDVSERREGQKVLIEEEQEVADVKFRLSMAWP
jgi:isoleucyl-tRNA synthetase